MNAKHIEKLMPALHKSIEKALKSKGMGNLRLTHLSLMAAPSGNLTPTCAGHWEWRCEMTPQGYVCHYVCVSN